MQINKDVFINYPNALSFPQQKRKSQFATKSNLITPYEPSPLTYNPKISHVIPKSPEVVISNSIINDLVFKNKVGPCDYDPKFI